MELLTIIAILLVCAFVFWKVVQILGNVFALIFGFIISLFMKPENRFTFLTNVERQIRN
jgi:hypothetical protein